MKVTFAICILNMLIPNLMCNSFSYGRRTKVLGFGLQNATVGIVGCGLIGSSIAKKLNAFSIRRLMYFARSEKPEGVIFLYSHVGTSIMIGAYFISKKF